MSTIGTHGIQNVTVNSSCPGQIRVTGDFVDGSTATGVFLIIYSLTNESDVLYITKQKEQNATVSLVDVVYSLAIIHLHIF